MTCKFLSSREHTEFSKDCRDECGRLCCKLPRKTCPRTFLRQNDFRNSNTIKPTRNQRSHTTLAQNSRGRDASNCLPPGFCIYNTQNPSSVTYCCESSSIDMAHLKSTSISRMGGSPTQSLHLPRSSKASKTSFKAPTRAKPHANPPSKQFLSKEFVYDSSSDNNGSQDDQQARQQRPTHPKEIQGRKDASHQETQEARRRHPPTPNQARFQRGHQAEEDSSSSSGASSSQRAHRHSHSSQVSYQDGKRTAVIEAATDVRPAPPFKPPLDFVEVSDPSPSTIIADFLQSSNHTGKTLWYITAPEDVPITFENVDINKLASGEPILSYQGRDYSLITDTIASQSSMRLMIPSNDGYTTASSPISQVMRLQQVVRPPHVRSLDSQPPAEARPSKLKRSQPSGLRMRYRPSGYDHDGRSTKKSRADV